MNKCFTKLLAMLLCPLSVNAASLSAPDAGSLLQQAAPIPQAPVFPERPALKIEDDRSSTLPISKAFLITRFQITGNTVLPTSALQALLSKEEGRSLNLAQLGVLTQKLTDYYRARGYLLARAMIPAQTITNGVVRIDIMEGNYGEISFINTSRVQSGVLHGLLTPLEKGQVIRSQTLDRSLLLLSDTNGSGVNASLKPGAAVGSADLTVEITPPPALSGNLALDNYGSRFTGSSRLGASLAYNNPLGLGDSLSLNLLTTGSGMQYGRLAYELLINRQGSRVGLSYSDLGYALGDSLANLQAHGKARVQSTWFRHPLLRSLEHNINGQLQFDRLDLRDDIDSAAIRTTRQVQSINTNLSGDSRDALLGGGFTSWSLGMSGGLVDLNDPASKQTDAATARSDGSYIKWNANLMRQQSIGKANALLFGASAQWANSNLDSSQKIAIGGPFSVRSLAIGSSAGDSAFIFNAEYRHALGLLGQGQLTAMTFFDSASVMINARPWISGKNLSHFYGAGLGLMWTHPKQWTLRSFVATPLWSEPGSNPAPVQGWLSLSKGF
jgi:hemolysin activation/secretion protein